MNKFRASPPPQFPKKGPSTFKNKQKQPKKAVKRVKRPSAALSQPKKPSEAYKSPTQTRKTEYILAPDQSLAQFQQLKAKWDQKLAASGFKDIEYTNEWGQTGSLMKNGGLESIARSYSPATAEYYRRARIFLIEFDWDRLSPSINPALARFIWTHVAEGYRLRTVEALLANKPTNMPCLVSGRRPLCRTAKGPQREPASLFWIHMALHKWIYPAFASWCLAEANGALKVDLAD